MELIEKALTEQVIGAAMEVHRFWGHGFLEPLYQEALEMEFRSRGVKFESQSEVKIRYKNQTLVKTCQPDLWVEDRLIVELKALDQLSGIEEAQLLNYLKATGIKVGLLINFGAPSLQWKTKSLLKNP